MYIYHIFFIHLSVNGQLGFFFTFSYMTNACEHLCTNFCVDIHFQFSWVYISKSGIAGSHDNSLQLFAELPDCFPKQMYHSTFPPVGYEGSSISTSSPRLVSLPYSQPYSSEGEVVCHCGFDL